MQLQEWLNKKEKNIFLDQDNTLLLLEPTERIARLGSWANNNAIFVNIMGYMVGILPRPNVIIFLHKCRELGNVYILTAGVSHFQKQVLEAAKLLHLVDDVFGRDNYHEVPQDKSGILVDNLPHDHQNTVGKLNAMGGGVMIKVPDWYGLDEHDDVLLKVIPYIEQACETT